MLVALYIATMKPGEYIFPFPLYIYIYLTSAMFDCQDLKYILFWKVLLLVALFISLLMVLLF